ncbi:MAG: peroxiredoxin [Gammaproteobacteria bacterium]|nr:peroxiredoxin [Gammaproteobacteria bacterium]
MLKIGDTAPDFELQDQSGSIVSLDQENSDGDLILYFYPADFTPICTAEACAFRDTYEGVSNVGARIIGVSPQSVESHRRFSKQFSIPFPLASDPGKKVIRAYGVDGPLGFGVRRVTFLIDSSKVIRNRVVSDLFVGSHTDLLKKTLRAHDKA